MKFIFWKEWYKALHWSQKWFVIFIFIRPVIDNFYYLKEVSSLLSPLYIAGVLTFVFALQSIFSLRKKYNSPLDFYMGIWTFIILLSCFFIFIHDPFTLRFFESSMKLILPVIIYFFARRMINSTKDIDGILQTFLYSAGIGTIIFTYQLFFLTGGIQITRGMERFHGGYADMMNFAILISQSFLIAGYFYFKKKSSFSQFTKTSLLWVVLVIGLFGLIKITHTATYFVYAMLLFLFIAFNLRQNFGPALFIILIFCFFGYNFGQEAIDKYFTPLVTSDIAVVQGEQEQEQLFHGRVRRWSNMWDEFSSEPVTSQFFGITLSVPSPYKYLAAGTHNDYLRVLFSTGFIGLIFYLLILFNIFLSTKNLESSKKYLGMGTLAMLGLYSVTTAPTMYVSMVYIIYSIFAYLALPKKIIQET